MDLKIGLIGAQGRLGKAIQALYPVFPITRNTSRKHLNCDVLIDVSSPQALIENLSANLPIVIGTTGHSDFNLIETAASNLPIFYSPNFSLGAALLTKMAGFVAHHFPSDIDLIEMHHSKKKDMPSGTALHLAKFLKNAKIHSIRSAETLGEHILIFNHANERLTLSHQVHNKEAFAQGAVLAAQFLSKQLPGLYGMDHLLDFLYTSLKPEV